jgi:hypothetical protein
MVDAAQRDFTARCGLPADEFFADAFTSEADKQDEPAPASGVAADRQSNGVGRRPRCKRAPWVQS